jgi:hypothetical protein
MTVKEIAELCGVEVHTIRNWINKASFLKVNFTLRNAIKEKLEGGSPERPADFLQGLADKAGFLNGILPLRNSIRDKLEGLSQEIGLRIGA